MSNSLIAILRAIHITFGAFWLGGLITEGFFLFPLIKAADFAGSPLTVRLILRTRLLAVLTAAGVISVLAGVLLYHDIWAGAGHNGPARWYAIGGYFAIVAVILTGAIALPTVNKLDALARARVGLGWLSPTTSPSGEQHYMTSRMIWATRLSAVLVTITIALMAAARYLY